MTRTPLYLLIYAAPLLAVSPLQMQIATIAAESQGTVSVACSLPGSKLNCNLLASARPPMQSVFKFPMAMAMLHRIEQGEFQLDQPIRFLPSDRILPRTYSPLQDKFPEANVDVPLRELLRLAVSLSDNAAADTVLRLLGGPAPVTAYIRSLGAPGFNLQDNEAALHRDSKAQYRNWFQPDSAVRLLRRLNDRSPLNREHTALLLTWMTESLTGMQRIKGQLPPGAIVAHKTGTSGVANGVTNATNDIGLIALPNGKKLAIAVFVTDAKADAKIIESVIARIAKAAYDAAANRK